MKGIKAGYPVGLKRNLSSAAGEQQNSVYTHESSDFQKNGHAATICVGVIIAVALLVLCGLLCYRQLNRRKKQAGITQEKARRESIRQAVRLRLQELQHLQDSTPWLGQAEIKSPSVTFGGVVLINPRESPMDSPVLDHRKYGEKYAQQQAYHQLHHHSIYNGRKLRVFHTPHPRDSLTTYHQQRHVQSLQRKLDFQEDHSKDNKIHMYPNSDHHRLSVHNKLQPATEHVREASMNSTNIHLCNNEHHRVSAHNKLQPATEHVQEAGRNSTNIHLCNNEHDRVSADNKFQPATEHLQEAERNSTNILVYNKVHHKLSLQKKFQPATNHFREAAMSSTNLLMPNNEHHKLVLQKQLQPTAERGRDSAVHSADTSPLMYRAHHFNGSSIGRAHLSQKSSATTSWKVVLHNGYSPRKPRSYTVPMDVDVVY